MPLFEYQCEACEHRFEKIQKFSDPLEDACPACGGSAKRLPSSPAIQFRGSGFYITDYAKKSSSDAGTAGGVKDSESKTGTDSKTSTDSKTDSKADSGSKDSTPSSTKKTD
ncbi:MAG: hypothetical protein A3H96_25410 [Acidobacteria bacterium RIFCSPLOWO2_02_FULL_67_36]|nr:MAG: hypothetical protein A3H96_25410 [Acidobacteria bacterium RIFCSPLOWO2_02_FULL_67_36]OFW22896.1 MAG: hypothetical protein A3G21_01135 [Acidobacteria bacterium RIFCSPLOWO2_12_FULL_66_21]